MSTILERILQDTRASLPPVRARRRELEAAAAAAPAAIPFGAALRTRRVAVIAELKRKSPSAGTIRADLDPLERGTLYARAGAAALSILTDERHFGGSIRDLEAVAGRVEIPLLRKDFIVDEIQLVEARAAGASAVLLIVRALESRRLAELLREAADHGLEALVETHDRPELEAAVEAGASIIGVNARSLDDFGVDFGRSLELIGSIPPDRIAVAESGVSGGADVSRAADAGADAVLVGSALSASDHPEELVRELAGVARRGR